jgi:hypothetical protein
VHPESNLARPVGNGGGDDVHHLFEPVDGDRLSEQGDVGRVGLDCQHPTPRGRSRHGEPSDVCPEVEDDRPVPEERGRDRPLAAQRVLAPGHTRRDRVPE